MSQATAPTLSRTDELNAIGAKLYTEGHLEPARLHFLAALALDSNHPQVLQNLGAVLRDLRHYDAAYAVTKRSVVLTNGENAYCLSNLGVAQLALRKYAEALATLEGVCKALPDSGPSWHNLGLCLYLMGRYDRALAAFDKCIALAPTPSVMSDRALTLLALGRIAEGLEQYECRWDMLARSPIWQLPVPEWKGEDLADCHILLHHEQGFGDSIMLARFVQRVATQARRVTLAVPQALVRLFAHSFPFVNVRELNDVAVDATAVYDYHSPLLSTMRWCGVARPDDIAAPPYLTALAQAPVALPAARVKVGICWASGDHSPALIDRRRLVPLTLFLPLLDTPGVAIVSLQKGGDVKDIVAHGLEGLVFDVSQRLGDFADTASVISQLDFVISVDSAVAHLAGALGKPCLMLSPYTRCWRWWGKTVGWPWYNHMKLYSQSANGTWTEAMRAVVEQAQWMMKAYRVA